MTGPLCLPEHIETQRLLLRPFSFADVDDVLAFAADEEWGKYLLGVPRPYRRSDAEQFLTRQTELDRSVHPTWALVLNDSAVGGINIRFKYDHVVADMGWSIHRRLWGRGLTTEAGNAVVSAAFSTYSALARIGATADERNVASHRVMEKIGMSREGTLRRNRIGRGECIDEAVFSILRSEWEARPH